jgi:AcrR family transcriptional regulator
MTGRGTQGSYAKGIAKRKEILAAALEAYATSGHAGPTLNTIAESVGLTVAGVLHYFPSREHLFVEILRARDEADLARLEAADPPTQGPWEVLRHAAATPGLVKLFVDMSAAAADPGHPAHTFMQTRTSGLVARLAALNGLAEDDWRAPLLVAAAEGLQIQWLRDPSVDVVGQLQRLAAALI